MFFSPLRASTTRARITAASGRTVIRPPESERATGALGPCLASASVTPTVVAATAIPTPSTAKRRRERGEPRRRGAGCAGGSGVSARTASIAARARSHASVDGPGTSSRNRLSTSSSFIVHGPPGLGLPSHRRATDRSRSPPGSHAARHVPGRGESGLFLLAHPERRRCPRSKGPPRRFHAPDRR